VELDATPALLIDDTHVVGDLDRQKAFVHVQLRAIDQGRCRSDKLSRLCSDKLIHPGSALGRGFLFPSSGRGGRVLAEGRSDAKENPRLTCSTLTCRLGKTGTYLSALAS
jgi:hypothetical protein